MLGNLPPSPSAVNLHPPQRHYRRKRPYTMPENVGAYPLMPHVAIMVHAYLWAQSGAIQGTRFITVSHMEIADHIHRDRSSVFVAIRALKKHGLVALIDQGGTPTNPSVPNTYAVFPVRS